MKAIQLTLSRTAGLLAGATLVLASARAAEADAFPTFDNNYIKFSANGATLNGSKAAYQARTQSSKAGAGGIEEFAYGYDLSKDTNLQVDGKAMASDANYLAEFKLTKNEVGTLEAGYKSFRTFYDGSGGFFPTNNAWMPIYRQPDFVDRGKFFVNATLALPKAPVITFKYSNDTRTGIKPSTIWGDSDLTGIPIMVGPGASNPISADRKILPAYIQLGERTETWEASVKQSVGNTTATFTVGGDRINNRDTRSIGRYIGELKSYPAFSSTTLVAAPQNVTQSPNIGGDQQGFRENGLFVAGNVETVLSEKITLFAGFNYRHATEAIDASRLLTTPLLTGVGLLSPIAGYTNGGRPAYSYVSAGSLKMDVITANVGVRATPLPSLNVEVALKGEQYKDSGTNNGTYYATNMVLATGVSNLITVVTPQSFKNSEKPWTPGVDVRYTGIRNLALYGSWEFRTTKQDERTNYGAFNVTTSGANAGQLSYGQTLTNDKIKENHQNVTLGANWTPMSIFSGRAELFSKDHENRFNGYGTSLGSYYTLDYDIYGAKLTGIVKPMPTLGFTTRYIIQRGKASTVEDGFAKNDTNDARRHQISETIDWNPSKAVYVQANGSLVYDNIASAYPYVTGTAKDVIRNAKNNYWNGDVIVGHALDKDTDVQLQGTYYKADNFDPAQAYATLPLGAGAKEYTVTAGVRYKYDSKTVISAKAGYIDSNNTTTGGFTDFRGPLAYVSVTRAF